MNFLARTHAKTLLMLRVVEFHVAGLVTCAFLWNEAFGLNQCGICISTVIQNDKAQLKTMR